MKLYIFRTVPLSIIWSLVTVQSTMVNVIQVYRQLSSRTWNSISFGQFLCPLSGLYSLYTQQWFMSDSFTAGPGWNRSSILVLLESCLQTCMTYTIAECTVTKLLMMDRGSFRNMLSFMPE